jgi:immune inhibitor A
MHNLFLDYKRSVKEGKLSFKEYLVSVGFIDPAADTVGMDDAAQFVSTPGGPELLAIPSQPILGEVQVKVLLVDFDDMPGTRPKEQFEDLLFSRGIHPTGSMRDYFHEVSLGKVDVVGTVSDWIRMPQRYSFYTNGESGTQGRSYPKNAQRMAEDAVQAALAKGVQFDRSLDTFDKGFITALFIVHAGLGAEKQNAAERGQHIWSHKWQLPNPVRISDKMTATIYLTVPQDCKLGVCAHELGHLVFQWQDFYDPNYNSDGTSWDGTGDWDLMASGSYNGGELKPAHPAPLHKIQHGWVPLTTVTNSTGLRIRPYSATTGRVFKLVSPAFKPKQYLLLESRIRTGFDSHLPGEGLLVWKVDEPGEQFGPEMPGLSLIQADGQNNMNNPSDVDQGDAGDPFPGNTGRTSLGDLGQTSTSFPDRRSGISLRNISIDEGGVVSLDVKFAGAGAGKAPARPKAGVLREGVIVRRVRKAPAKKATAKRANAKATTSKRPTAMAATKRKATTSRATAKTATAKTPTVRAAAIKKTSARTATSKRATAKAATIKSAATQTASARKVTGGAKKAAPKRSASTSHRR